MKAEAQHPIPKADGRKNKDVEILGTMNLLSFHIDVYRIYCTVYEYEYAVALVRRI